MALNDAMRELPDKASYIIVVGAGTFAGWLSDNWLGLIGVVIAALGLAVNWYYSHQRHKLMKEQQNDQTQSQ
ncbi:holin [Microbulbifer sp. GL-2]|uniref:holin n=1 Tax=Microbulbifer sp. GL-2 TaxID=2591606 RepID=UPI001163061F|nr:holin [Microbulbifer sp. GL-2]BBM03795.1 hypothetical protein GL2_38690 [Microbulbifer sp. GL-2]